MSKKASAKKSLGSFFGALLAILAFRWILFEPFVIPSGSMIPTLLINDHIIVSKYDFGLRIPFTKTWLIRWGEVKRGDVVIFNSVGSQSYFMVKRVLAVGGDTVKFNSDGSVSINGVPLEREKIESFESFASLSSYYPIQRVDIDDDSSKYELFLEKDGESERRVIQFINTKNWSSEEYKVPENHFMVVGDNRDNSSDSRYWGFLPENHLMGRAGVIWLSCTESLVGSNFLCNPSTIRWKRFFHSVK